MLRIGLDDPVLIIGAGICGLAIAHGLHEADIPFLIFDAAEDGSDLYTRDWPMCLQSESMPLLKSLLPRELADRLETYAAVDKMLDGEYGGNTTWVFDDPVIDEVVGEIKPDGKRLRISRAKLIALCHERINVKYGHTLQDVELSDNGTVAAIFTNGERQIGSVLIGADGRYSTVRKALFGLEKARLNPTDGTWTPTPWHTRGGRVTLAGDAAHTMTVDSNRGLDNAITDAYDFVETIKAVVAGNRVRAGAIPSYSIEVAARGAKEVELSKRSPMPDWASSSESGLLRTESAATSVRSNAGSRRQLLLPAEQSTRQRVPSVRKAWSHARLWMTNSIENLDRGPKQGTAQTGWVEVGYREYGRRHFPPD